jgi:DNA-binding GntR family transcriptional regulator
MEQDTKAAKTLPPELAARLRKEILSERLPPASKLTEDYVSRKYGMSRTPVREAFRILESERLIELVPNRGAFVIGFSEKAAADLFSLRALLEVKAVSWAVERAEEEELDAIEQALEFLEFHTRREDLRRIRELGMNFHREIQNAARNAQLSDSLERCRLYLGESKHVSRIAPAELSNIQQEHAAIFEAFRLGDPEYGAEAMRVHLENAAKRSLHSRDLAHDMHETYDWHDMHAKSEL